jgi:hypothetical protein
MILSIRALDMMNFAPRPSSTRSEELQSVNDPLTRWRWRIITDYTRKTHTITNKWVKHHGLWYLAHAWDVSTDRYCPWTRMAPTKPGMWNVTCSKSNTRRLANYELITAQKNSKWQILHSLYLPCRESNTKPDNSHSKSCFAKQLSNRPLYDTEYYQTPRSTVWNPQTVVYIDNDTSVLISGRWQSGSEASVLSRSMP